MHQPLTEEKSNDTSSIYLRSIKRRISQPESYRFILVIFKLLVGLALLVLSIQGIQWGNLINGILSASLWWLALAFGSVLIGLLLKVLRWSIFIRNYQIQASHSKIYSSYFVGLAANIIFPFRGGELIRLGYFASDAKILPDVGSAIVMEKYLDLLALTTCAILVSLKISMDNIQNLRGFLLPLTVILTILLLLTTLLGPTVWKKMRSRRLLPRRVEDWVERWFQSSQWLRNPKQIAPGLLLTIIIWVVMWSTNWLLFKSLELPLGGTAAGLVLVLIFIGLLPALMPGNIGPFYYFARLALVPFSIANNQAFTYVILLHAVVTIPPLLGGVVGLWLVPSHKSDP